MTMKAMDIVAVIGKGIAWTCLGLVGLGFVIGVAPSKQHATTQTVKKTEPYNPCVGHQGIQSVDEVWNKIWYLPQYSVCIDQLTVEKKPRDCDYYTAPLGYKNCHYEERIMETRVAKSAEGR